MKLSVIAAEAGSSGKSATRGSIDATNQGESSRLLQSALKDRSKNGSSTNEKKSEVTLDVVQRRYSKDQKHHEEIERMSEEGEIKEEEDERSDKSDEQNETVRREMEAKREKSHTTKRVEVLEDEAYI